MKGNCHGPTADVFIHAEREVNSLSCEICTNRAREYEQKQILEGRINQNNPQR